MCKYKRSSAYRLWQLEQLGHSGVKLNGPGLCRTWLRELWRWLMLKGLKQPCSLVWVRMHCKVGIEIDMNRYVNCYVGIVSVCCRLQLQCRLNSLHGEALICDKHYQPRLADVPTTNANRLGDIKVQVSSDILSDMISCSGWADSDRKGSALIPRLYEHDSLLGFLPCYHRAHHITATMLSWTL